MSWIGLGCCCDTETPEQCEARIASWYCCLPLKCPLTCSLWPWGYNPENTLAPAPCPKIPSCDCACPPTSHLPGGTRLLKASGTVCGGDITFTRDGEERCGDGTMLTLVYTPAPVPNPAWPYADCEGDVVPCPDPAQGDITYCRYRLKSLSIETPTETLEFLRDDEADPWSLNGEEIPDNCDPRLKCLWGIDCQNPIWTGRAWTAAEWCSLAINVTVTVSGTVTLPGPPPTPCSCADWSESYTLTKDNMLAHFCLDGLVYAAMWQVSGDPIAPQPICFPIGATPIFTFANSIGGCVGYCAHACACKWFLIAASPACASLAPIGGGNPCDPEIECRAPAFGGCASKITQGCDGTDLSTPISISESFPATSCCGCAVSITVTE